MSDNNLFDGDQIRQLATLMEETDLEELELGDAGRTLRLRRPSAHGAVAEVSAPAATQEPTTTQEPAPKGDDGKVIKAPMVGTFYYAASPESAPFVQPGDKVSKGQVIGIIEAMKTMNQIEADQDGVMKGFLSENAQPVEFGEPLLLVE